MVEEEERRGRCRIVVFLQIKHTSVGVVETVHPTSHAVLYPDVSSQPGNNCLSSPAPLHVHSLPLSHVFPAHLPFLFFFSSCCNYKLCTRIIVFFTSTEFRSIYHDYPMVSYLNDWPLSRHVCSSVWLVIGFHARFHFGLTEYPVWDSFRCVSWNHLEFKLVKILLK